MEVRRSSISSIDDLVREIEELEGGEDDSIGKQNTEVDVDKRGTAVSHAMSEGAGVDRQRTSLTSYEIDSLVIYPLIRTATEKEERQRQRE